VQKPDALSDLLHGWHLKVPIDVLSDGTKQPNTG
jgi:hypothetical protein